MCKCEIKLLCPMQLLDFEVRLLSLVILNELMVKFVISFVRLRKILKDQMGSLSNCGIQQLNYHQRKRLLNK